MAMPRTFTKRPLMAMAKLVEYVAEVHDVLTSCRCLVKGGLQVVHGPFPLERGRT